MSYLSELDRAIEVLASMPLIGERTAQKITFWLIRDKRRIDDLLNVLKELRDRVEPCRVCYALTVKERQPCDICVDESREPIMCVVASPADVLTIERAGIYRGYYHVLGGVISPLEGIGPDSLRIAELIDRLRSGRYEELILALPPTVEGETTAYYLMRRLRDEGIEVKVTGLAHGLPVGAQLDYADTLTLAKALENRKPMSLEE